MYSYLSNKLCLQKVLLHVSATNYDSESVSLIWNARPSSAVVILRCISLGIHVSERV